VPDDAAPGNAWAAAPSLTPGVPNYYAADQNYWAGGQPQSGTNAFAVASFVLGLLGAFGITLVLSVIFGILSLGQIRRQPQRGKGLAIAGLCLSGLWVAIFVAVFVAAALTASPQSATPGQVTTGGNMDVLSLRKGDCFQNPSGATPAAGTVTEVTAVSCTTPHDAQVIAILPVSGSAYPGKAGFQAQAEPACHAAVKADADQSKLTSTMSVLWIYPEEDAWTGGDHSISCVVVDTSADLTSSLLK
jgi:hypothetical protein